MNVELISITPDAEKTMAHIARVSNPSNQDNPNYAGCWLNIIWPFCLAALIDKGNNFIKNISISFFNFSSEPFEPPLSLIVNLTVYEPV